MNDHDFLTFNIGDVVEYCGDCYHSLVVGQRGIVVDTDPVKHGIAYVVEFVGGILPAYFCFDTDIKAVTVHKVGESVH